MKRSIDILILAFALALPLWLTACNKGQAQTKALPTALPRFPVDAACTLVLRPDVLGASDVGRKNALDAMQTDSNGAFQCIIKGQSEDWVVVQRNGVRMGGKAGSETDYWIPKACILSIRVH